MLMGGLLSGYIGPLGYPLFSFCQSSSCYKDRRTGDQHPPTGEFEQYENREKDTTVVDELLIVFFLLLS